MKRTIGLVSPHLRTLLAVAVIVVPVALVAPGAVRGEVRMANGYSAVFAVPHGVVIERPYNRALVVGVVAHVPPHASLATVGGGGQLGTAWTRWVPYVIAPRQMTTGRAKWTMVFGETPQQAHLHPARSWRYGTDWLVEG